MKIALVTDAWSPQVNGVVRTLQTVCDEIRNQGHKVEVINPGEYSTVPCPTYPEIRLSYSHLLSFEKRMDEMHPDCIHIATEGPLGYAAQRYCAKRNLPFTTSFHTKFPEYVEARVGLPADVSYKYLRWFHKPAERMMVATPTLKRELEERGFTNCEPWTRGVDTTLFNPDKAEELDLPKPIHLYVGRVAVEKNIKAFLDLPLEGTKLVVGGGPQLAELKEQYTDAVFVGEKHGEELAKYYASSDVFVFPSKTDTFGLVMLEALASGTPVAAYPVTGPIDVIKDEKAGILNEDLKRAIDSALKLNREDCREYAEGYSWARCAEILLNAFANINREQRLNKSRE